MSFLRGGFSAYLFPGKVKGSSCGRESLQNKFVKSQKNLRWGAGSSKNALKKAVSPAREGRGERLPMRCAIIFKKSANGTLHGLISMKITCPICKTVTTWEENPHRPFCSERCRLIDLGKWAQEEYRIAGRKQDEEDEGREPEDGQ